MLKKTNSQLQGSTIELDVETTTEIDGLQSIQNPVFQDIDGSKSTTQNPVFQPS